ncbi:MAG: hypothetical protein HFE86_03015 [Clostridiales bacterium]|nr:hypothetical protein [Clostridiales bacterium]
MKKWLATAISITLAASALFSASADASLVGVIGAGGLPAAFDGKEAVITQRFKEAYQWAQTLHAQRPQDGNFSFGDSSGELVHSWAGTDVNGQVYTIVSQDFDGGNSIAEGAFALNNWAALICADPETCQVIVMRDAPAEYYINGGGVHNWQSGNPITNQYWRMEGGIPILYQQFENGYLRCEDGESWYAEFYNKADEGDYYVEPPQAPPAYGDIHAVNQDGCSWENPKYIPGGPIHSVGDMNGNGRIAIDDVMELCKVLARQSAGSKPTAVELERGDLNGDGSITIEDVMELCKVLARQA